MKAYLCIWPNGDLSIVQASSTMMAMQTLDIDHGGADDPATRIISLPAGFALHLMRGDDEADGPMFYLEGLSPAAEQFIATLPSKAEYDRAMSGPREVVPPPPGSPYRNAE